MLDALHEVRTPWKRFMILMGAGVLMMVIFAGFVTSGFTHFPSDWARAKVWMQTRDFPVQQQARSPVERSPASDVRAVGVDVSHETGRRSSMI